MPYEAALFFEIINSLRQAQGVVVVLHTPCKTKCYVTQRAVTSKTGVLLIVMATPKLMFVVHNSLLEVFEAFFIVVHQYKILHTMLSITLKDILQHSDDHKSLATFSSEAKAILKHTAIMDQFVDTISNAYYIIRSFSFGDLKAH